MRSSEWVRELRGQPRFAPREVGGWKYGIVFAVYLALAEFLPFVLQDRAGHPTVLVEMMPALVLLAFLLLGVATDSFERSLRARVLLVIGTMALYFLFGLPFMEFLQVDAFRFLHTPGWKGEDHQIAGRSIVGMCMLTNATHVSRWMRKDPHRSLDMQLV